MSRVRKRWLYSIIAAVVICIVALITPARIASQLSEPFIREQATLYLSERVDCNVELASLKIHMPKLSPIKMLLVRGRVVIARGEVTGIWMRYRNATDLPQLYAFR